jgi:hypothetical protein
MSWQHPETCYPPATLAALRSGKANADLLEQRQVAWKDAVRGLYHALRHRQCDAFYLATPLVTITSFSPSPSSFPSACNEVCRICLQHFHWDSGLCLNVEA